ncbi:ADP-heptose:LPS heptosyltransferase [Bradyrhizobium huanghuaihaiense]|uniref:ADP-heptose:LPS heptosyltransferase n=1 Tax=Bradyrhizobium huanghuaihaiense TaxID=990078 RepID=A0A562QUF9_9BRAD|nr:glycosyltransferase family 9 protein [Bradyrhizobium huanghuaihaiense]TWI60263.1 ADP-heptose:LPS heptosyltransferase [Bradyrhizobium huanghuaihaiense]
MNTAKSDEATFGRIPVVFFGNGLGDNLLALPAVRALCAGFEGRARLVLQSGPHQFLFDGLPVASSVFLKMWTITRNGLEFDTRPALKTLEGCDTFISLAEWKSSSLNRLRSACQAKVTIGFMNDSDVQLPNLHVDHQFDFMFSIPRHIFPHLTIDQFSGPIRFPWNVCGAGEEIVRCFENKVIVGLHPESSEPNKSCAPELTERLVRDLLKLRADLAVCVFAQGPEYSTLKAISERLVVFNYLPFDLAAYLVSRMNLFIGVDSCFLHVCDLCRVPGVGLFGPTESKLWGFRFSTHVHICSRSLAQMEAGHVIEAASGLIRR